MAVTLGNTDLTISGGGSNPVKIRQTVYGYSSTYNVLQLGEQANGQSVSLFVDPSSNASGSFNGNGRELIVPQTFSMISPTSSNTSFKSVIQFNDGPVTMPNQPVFNVFRNVNTVSIAANTAFVFNAARRNVGGHFNLSTNRFTAPVAGTYWFTFETIQIGNLSDGQFNFRVNGSNLDGTNRHFGNSTGGWITISGTTLTYLNAGDFLEVIIGTASAYHGNTWNAFCGYLIG